MSFSHVCLCSSGGYSTISCQNSSSSHRRCKQQAWMHPPQPHCYRAWPRVVVQPGSFLLDLLLLLLLACQLAAWQGRAVEVAGRSVVGGERWAAGSPASLRAGRRGRGGRGKAGGREVLR